MITRRTATRSGRLGRLIAPASALLCLAALLAAWAAWQAGWAGLTTSLQAIGRDALLPGACVCMLSLALRWARWQTILRRQGHRLRAGLQLRIYLAGVALSATPGKLGETWRSALLLAHGVPLPQSLAAFATDRLSDVIGLAALGGAAAWLAGRGSAWLALAAAALLGASLVIAAGTRAWLRHPGTGAAQLQPGSGAVPGRGLRRLGSRLAAPAQAWAASWRWRPALAYVAVAACVYGLQAGLFVACVRLTGSALPLVDGLAVFASATLIGAASLLPGGLGAMDTALVLQLEALGVARPDAIAATLVTRVCTLGLSWLLGLCALASFAAQRQPGGPTAAAPLTSFHPTP